MERMPAMGTWIEVAPSPIITVEKRSPRSSTLDTILEDSISFAGSLVSGAAEYALRPLSKTWFESAPGPRVLDFEKHSPKSSTLDTILEESISMAGSIVSGAADALRPLRQSWFEVAPGPRINDYENPSPKSSTLDTILGGSMSMAGNLVSGAANVLRPLSRYWFETAPAQIITVEKRSSKQSTLDTILEDSMNIAGQFVSEAADAFSWGGITKQFCINRDALQDNTGHDE